MQAPALEIGAKSRECAVCNSDGAITYGVTVNVSNYEHPAGVQSASYIQLFASFEPKDEALLTWYAVSTAKVLDGLYEGENSVEVCEKQDSRDTVSDAPTLAPTAPTAKPTVSPAAGRRLVDVPAPSPTYEVETSKCCMGSPGAVYLVACITKVCDVIMSPLIGSLLSMCVNLFMVVLTNLFFSISMQGISEVRHI